MGKQTIIPFGPQHPVLPEPIHLDLVLEDEQVLQAIPRIGFVHRGLEKLAEKKDFQDMVYVGERICGICSFIHSVAFCQAMESILGIEVPERAQSLRGFWSELSRIHSHWLWMGLLADSFGFENLFMQTWKLRESLLDLVEATAGGRVIYGSCKIGGVRRDISLELITQAQTTLKALYTQHQILASIFENDTSIQHRTQGKGMLSKDKAYELGAVGPTLRASGWPLDARLLKYGTYQNLEFQPVVETQGDCYARMRVRIREVDQSFDLINQLLKKLPDGPVETKITGMPSGEHFERVEQPRGEVVHYLKGNGSKFLERYRVRTPTFANLPALVEILKGCTFADVPIIVLSIDPCISCTER